MLNLLLITLLTGAVGLGLGGFVGTLIGGASKKINAILLSFAAGTMIALISFELLPEASETEVGGAVVAGFALLGAALVTCLDYVADKHSGHSQDFITCADCDEEFEHDAAHLHCAHADGFEGHAYKAHHANLHEELHSRHVRDHHAQDSYTQDPHTHETHAHNHEMHVHGTHGEIELTHHHKRTSKLQLLLAGIVMAVGVAIHNVPEGMSIGALYAAGGGHIDHGLFILLFSIVLHNVPEGMAIALSLFTGGMNRFKAAGVAALSGVPTVLGAAAGYMLGDMGPFGLAVSMSFAAGTLLYVVFGEVLPQSINLYCSRKTAFAAIMGLIAGMLLIGVHHVH